MFGADKACAQHRPIAAIDPRAGFPEKEERRGGTEGGQGKTRKPLHKRRPRRPAAPPPFAPPHLARLSKSTSHSVRQNCPSSRELGEKKEGGRGKTLREIELSPGNSSNRGWFWGACVHRIAARSIRAPPPSPRARGAAAAAPAYVPRARQRVTSASLFFPNDGNTNETSFLASARARRAHALLAQIRGGA